MAAEFNNQEEPNDTVFPVNFKENSNLDMYGVWIKKTPEAKTAAPVSPDDSALDDNVVSDDEEINFDEHDIIDLNELEDDGIRIADTTEHNKTSYGQSNEIVEFDNIDGLASMAGITGFDTSGSVEEIIKDTAKEETLDSLPEFQSGMDDNKEKDTDMDINEFETLDLEDFLSEDVSSAPEAADSSQKDTPVEDTQIEETSFDSITNKQESEPDEIEPIEELNITENVSAPVSDNLDVIEETSEFDDLLNELEETQTAPADAENTLTNSENDIDIAVTIDEESDISSLAGKTMSGNEDLEDIAIFTEKPKQEQAVKQDISTKNKDELVIESTVIEAGNIDKIKEENQRILHESEHNTDNPDTAKDNNDIDAFDSMLDDLMGTSSPEPVQEEKKEDVFFDDVEAVKNDLFDDVPAEIDDTSAAIDDTPAEISEAATTAESAAPKAEQTSAPVFQNDRATEILLQIAGELSSIKTQLSTLKEEIAAAKIQTGSNIDAANNGITSAIPGKMTEKEGNGFFTDDDGDETIALTGDELNNILITADFTEENAKDELEETMESPAVPTFEDETLPNDIETGHINSISEDLSYLEQDDEIFTKDEENTEDYIDMPDFSNEQMEEPNFENFDLTIKELELPDGQSIHLGDAEETFDMEGSLDAAAISDTDIADISEETFDANKPAADETETLDTIDFISEEPEDASNDDFEIPEELIIDETSEEKTLSAEDLNETIEDISHLQFDTSVAEEYKQEITPVEDDTAAEESPMEESIAEEHITAEPAAEETAIKPEPAQKQGLSEKAETVLSKNAENKVLPIHLKDEIKSVLTYMDQLLESLPEDKIEEFAKSEYFDTYKRLFEELGIS